MIISDEGLVIVSIAFPVHALKKQREIETESFLTKVCYNTNTLKQLKSSKEIRDVGWRISSNRGYIGIGGISGNGEDYYPLPSMERKVNVTKVISSLQRLKKSTGFRTWLLIGCWRLVKGHHMGTFHGLLQRKAMIKKHKDHVHDNRD